MSANRLTYAIHSDHILLKLFVLGAILVSSGRHVVLAGGSSKVVAGRRAIVCDERLSVLRTRPEIAAPFVQRLRRGRVIGITGVSPGRDGDRFYRVVVSSRTEGWILADAVARAGVESDLQKLIRMVESEVDGYARVKLASLMVTEFGRTRAAPMALLLLGESADDVADQLTRVANRRLKSLSSRRELYMLNDVGLDRYSRLGIRFRFEAAEERLVYDGAAYRILLRRYPRSLEAKSARARLK
ncbi:MAG: hypothetical protein ABI882_15985 [Acidobacteriota bacterium]